MHGYSTDLSIYLTIPCEQCGNLFEFGRWRLKSGPVRFCSQDCYHAYVGRRSPEERFWRFVAITDDETSCWLWQGRKIPSGYGSFSVKTQNVYAHRYALSLQLGRPLAPRMFSCHHCDTPSCVRNDGERSHLFEGTNADNVADAVRKGRMIPGRLTRWRSRHPESIKRGQDASWAKLRDEDVMEIRRRYAEEVITQQRLGEVYGLSFQAIHLIVTRKNWKHLP